MVPNHPAQRCQIRALRQHGVISRAEARAEGLWRISNLRSTPP